MIIVEDNIFKPVALRRHKQGRSSAVAPKQIAVTLLQGEQAVDCGPELTAHVPIVERRCQHDHIALLHGWIDLSHIVLLNAGTFLAAMAAKAALTAVDVHAVQKNSVTVWPALSAPSVNALTRVDVLPVFRGLPFKMTIFLLI